MSQYFVNPVQYDKAKLKYSDVLERMDRIVFPDGKSSLKSMTSDEADNAILNAFEERLNQGTLPANFRYFLSQYSDDYIDIDSILTVRKMILEIEKHKTNIWDNIKKKR